MKNHISPRIIRLKQAPDYLGMKRTSFDIHVRPTLRTKEIRIGRAGVGFDRLDLDRWIEEHKGSHAMTPVISQQRRHTLWQHQEPQASANAQESGTLIKKYSGDAFAKALERLL